MPAEHTAHSPSAPTLVGVPALYCVDMKLPAAHEVTAAAVKLVFSEPEHSVDTKLTPGVGNVQLEQVPLLFSSQPML